MKKTAFAGLALLALGGAYFVLPRLARAESAFAMQDRQQSKTVIGQVRDKDAAVPDAVVYLKNMKTLAVKTFIADANGNYRFHALAPNVDYQVHAEHRGRRSDARTVSSFDSRSEVTLNLQLK